MSESVNPEKREDSTGGVPSAGVSTLFSDNPSGSAFSGKEDILRTIQPEARYQIGGEVARGGMGAIHLAEHPALRRRVAVKTMLAGDASPDELARFIEEAQITGQLDHPGIVPVHELGVDAEGAHFYSMKFVQGRDLHAILEGLRSGDANIIEEFPLTRLLGIFDRVCDAMAFAHAHGVIHRDLKPGNIRLGEFGEVMVMDWGLAKLVGQPDQSPATAPETRRVSSIRGEEESGEFHTLAGSIMGSPQYMAPEQAAGEVESLDARADIYALGAILFEILTLTAPIEAKGDVYAMLDSVTAGRIQSPLRLNRGRAGKRRKKLPHCPGNRVPEALAKVATRALALQREDRYTSVIDLQGEIEAWLGGFATEAEQAGLMRQLRLFVRRNWIATVSAVVIGLVLLIGSIVNFQQRGAAVAALDSFEQAEQEKREQARRSAPAFLKSALALEQLSDFDNALITLERTLEFDPDLAGAREAQVYLLARAARWDETFDAAQLIPDGKDHSELLQLLEEASADDPPGVDRLTPLAKLAAAADMPSTATDLLAQAAENIAVDRKVSLPIWRAKLKQAWPGLSESIQVHPEHGLYLVLSKSENSIVTSLDPLRGIPLEGLDLSHLKVTNLEPLEGMPLRRLRTTAMRITSLKGIEKAPLKHFKFTSELRSLTAEMLAPLRGKDLDFCELNSTGSIDTSPLSEVQCRELYINYNSSLEFLRSQEALQSLSVYHATADGDWSPVFENRTLQKFRHHDRLHQAFDPVWNELADGNLTGAKQQVESLRASIANPALEITRQHLDFLGFLIDRKLGRATSLPTIEELMVPVGDGRIFVGFVQTFSSPAIFPKVLKALETLEVDLASLRSESDQRVVDEFPEWMALLTGGYRSRKDLVWRWRDESPWHYQNFAPGEAGREIIRYATLNTQWCTIDRSNLWISGQAGWPANSLLLQFPEAWLEEAGTND